MRKNRTHIFVEVIIADANGIGTPHARLSGFGHAIIRNKAPTHTCKLLSLLGVAGSPAPIKVTPVRSSPASSAATQIRTPRLVPARSKQRPCSLTAADAQRATTTASSCLTYSGKGNRQLPRHACSRPNSTCPAHILPTGLNHGLQSERTTAVASCPVSALNKICPMVRSGRIPRHNPNGTPTRLCASIPSMRLLASAAI